MIVVISNVALLSVYQITSRVLGNYMTVYEERKIKRDQEFALLLEKRREECRREKRRQRALLFVPDLVDSIVEKALAVLLDNKLI